MKALKEKRVSLRSLFRRSLVILSLFALVFASCGESGGTGPGTNGPGGPDTPTPTGPSVTSIYVLVQPTVVSFQGCVPDLSGIRAEVVWDNGDRDIIDDASKFYTLPGYCEEAGDDVEMSIGYKGYQVTSKGLKLSRVVRASGISITGATPKEWYSDDRPDFSGLTYEIIVDAGWPAYGKADTDTSGGYKKISQKMASAYPYVDISTIGSKYVTVSVTEPPVTGTSGANANTSTHSNLTTTFEVPTYYKVYSVQYTGNATWVDYLDSDIGKFGALSTPHTPASYTADYSKIKSEFVTSKVMFTVTYEGGRTREINMDKFYANDKWYRETWPSLAYLSGNTVISVGGVKYGANPATPATYTYGVDLFDIDEDTQVWEIVLEYAPAAYSGNATLSHVFVDVPIWQFNEEAKPEKKSGGGPGNPMIKGYTTAQSPIDAGDLDAIKVKWQLSGQYINGRATKDKAITITDQMIYDGYEAFLNPGGVASLTHTGTTFFPSQNLIGTDSWSKFEDTAVASGQARRDFPLPLFYRGVLLEDDETIYVDIWGQN